MDYTFTGNIRLNKNFAATLLVPSSMEEKLNERLKYYSKKNMYLRALLDKFNQELLDNIPRHTYPTTLYQNPNLDLFRFNFKTNGVDWFKLKMIAFHLGISMSFLFVLLMLLDEEGCEEVQVPTFCISLILSTTQNSAKSSICIHFIQSWYSIMFPKRE